MVYCKWIKCKLLQYCLLDGFLNELISTAFFPPQLRLQHIAGDDRVIRKSYQLLGVVSLLQLAITLTLQFNNLRQRQRARQEWKQHRNLPSRWEPAHNIVRFP